MDKPVNEWNDSFMKILFQDSDLLPNEARVLATEVFLSGIDSVSHLLQSIVLRWMIFLYILFYTFLDFVYNYNDSVLPSPSPEMPKCCFN